MQSSCAYKDFEFLTILFTHGYFGCSKENGKTAVNASLVGGETEALQRLRNFAVECKAKPNSGFKDGTSDSIYGANFSCKISPWLAMGCLSPRSMFGELKKSASR